MDFDKWEKLWSFERILDLLSAWGNIKSLLNSTKPFLCGEPSQVINLKGIVHKPFGRGDRQFPRNHAEGNSVESCTDST